MKPTPVTSLVPTDPETLHPELDEVASDLFLFNGEIEEMLPSTLVSTLPVPEQLKHLSDHFNDILEESRDNEAYALRMLGLLDPPDTFLLALNNI